jgi:hypothetical protein
MDRELREKFNHIEQELLMKHSKQCLQDIFEYIKDLEKKVSEDEDIIGAETTLQHMEEQIDSLIQLREKINKINRRKCGINRDLENMIHFSYLNLNKAFSWLDKTYFILKEEIEERKKLNELYEKLEEDEEKKDEMV